MKVADAATRPQQGAKVALALLLTGLGVWTIAEFLPALAWAGILAIAFWPLYQRTLRRWPPSRHNIVLPSVFTLGIALIVLIPLVVAGIQAAREAHSVFDWIDQVRTTGVAAPAFLARLPIGSEVATGWWNENLAEPGGAQQLLHRVNRSDIGLAGTHLGVEVVRRVVLFGFTLLTLFFLFRDGDRLAEQLRRASAKAFGSGGERVGRQMIASVHGTVDGLVLVGLGEGFLLGIGYVVAGVPHPALLGALTAVAAMIPFGAPLIFGLAGLLLVARGAVVAAVVIVVLGFIVTFVADHFIRPVLIGGATRLPFLWVLFGILGGVKTWGLLGLFLGPAIMAALILLWREWVEEP
jgi:predicted PurR-regulated permease PerM